MSPNDPEQTSGASCHTLKSIATRTPGLDSPLMRTYLEVYSHLGAGRPMAEKVEHWLAAILSADGVGYSRLMDAVDKGTPARRIHQGGSQASMFAGND